MRGPWYWWSMAVLWLALVLVLTPQLGLIGAFLLSVGCAIAALLAAFVPIMLCAAVKELKRR